MDALRVKEQVSYLNIFIFLKGEISEYLNIWILKKLQVAKDTRSLGKSGLDHMRSAPRVFV